jgi:predicted dehydrogenase
MNSRRDFLQKVSLGLSVSALSGLPAIASGHHKIVAKGMQECKIAKITGVISGTPSKIDTWKQKYGIADKNVYNYETVNQLKNNPDIDLVYVTTPNSLHHKHVLQIAAAGKHVLCEKPVADNAKQAREMIAACEKSCMSTILWVSVSVIPTSGD